MNAWVHHRPFIVIAPTFFFIIPLNEEKMIISIEIIIKYWTFKMIQDAHHSEFIQDRIFNHPLNHNFEKMTIEALKETQLKWGITDMINSKHGIISSLKQFISKMDYSGLYYCRIKIKTLNNDCSFWFEDNDIRGIDMKPLFVKTKVEINKETYDFESGDYSCELIYDDEWSKRFEYGCLKNAVNAVPSLITHPFAINYYNNLRKVSNYIETRSAHINACLFKDFLSNDVIQHIQSLL